MKSINARQESATIEGESKTLPVPTNSALQKSPQWESNGASELLKEASSDTMNYADNCMSELLTQMENVRNCGESRETDKMASIAMGARSLAEVMREKIAAMALLKNNLEQ